MLEMYLFFCFVLFWYCSHCDFLVSWTNFLLGERDLIWLLSASAIVRLSFSPSHLWLCDLVCHHRFLKDTPKSNSTQNVKSKKASSFLEFARSTNDAWDIDDEEDEDLLMGAAPPAPVPHSRPTVPTFLPTQPDSDSESHPSDTLGPLRSEPCHDQQMSDDRSTNGRVVRSNSEAQLNTSSGMQGYPTMPSLVFSLCTETQFHG